MKGFSNRNNFISKSNRDNNSIDNNDNQTNTYLKNLNKKIEDLEKKSAVWELQLQSKEQQQALSHQQQQQKQQQQQQQQQPQQQQQQQQLAETSYELQLQERKKNNLIIFGLQEDGRDDIYHLEALFSNLGVDVNVNNTQCFRIGRSLEKRRPLIMKLRNEEEKAEILFKAKGLKNNQNWQGVSITHDLTKQQYQAEKVKEMELKKEAEEKNCQLPADEKFARVWRVVGGRGTRRVVLRDKEIPKNQGCL